MLCSVEDGIYALDKGKKRSTLSLRSSPGVAFETVPMFVWLYDACSSFQGRSSSEDPFYASFLHAVDSVMSLALCLQVGGGGEEICNKEDC